MSVVDRDGDFGVESGKNPLMGESTKFEKDDTEFWLGASYLMFSSLATAPLNRVKLIRQAGPSLLQNRSGVVEKYSGSVTEVMKRLVKEQGFRSLWRGGLVNAISDLTGYFVLYPLTLVGNRLATQIGQPTQFQFHGAWGGLRQLWNAQASVATFTKPLRLRGLFVGFVSTFLAANSFSFSQILLHKGSNKLEDGEMLFGSGLLGLILVNSIMGYPLFTAALRMQCEATLPMEQRIYRNYNECTERIAQEEGFIGLYRGGSLAFLRCAIMFGPLFYYELNHAHTRSLVFK